MFGLLILAEILCTLFALPSQIRWAKWCARPSQAGGPGCLGLILTLLGVVFFAVVLIAYMASIGHVAVAIVLLIPTAISFLTGIIVGLLEVL